MVQVVWFKRDFRVTDHAPLAAAARAGAVLPLVIIEPQLWQQPDMAGRHYAFLCESVEELRQSLQKLGLPLTIRIGEATDVLATIHNEHAIAALHSHMETGNRWTFERDKRAAQWCKANAIPWHQPRQFGIVRATNNRDRWAAQWEEFMTSPVATLPEKISAAPLVTSHELPEAAALGLAPDPCPGRQTGGRSHALALLESFLNHRGAHFQKQMSSPLSAATACSRLSTHLAFGTVSMREVVQRTYHARLALADIPKDQRQFDLRALDAFIARLHWHCHFIQKLEDEPEVEHQCFHPAFENARPSDSEDSTIRLQAWATGQTGWPFVDACMRSLIETGWINFRMRAMLMAVASYHLWLDWRQSGTVLARYFTDYEPGIHWSQSQMQSGTTGINTLRIYNPIKQSQDQDPTGHFIRRWVPELAAIPDTYIHAPWTMPPLLQRECGVVIGEHYPHPITNHEQAARDARTKMTNLRAQTGFYEEQKRVLAKHGSRKGKGMGKRAFPDQNRMLKEQKADAQLRLDL